MVLLVQKDLQDLRETLGQTVTQVHQGLVVTPAIRAELDLLGTLEITALLDHLERREQKECLDQMAIL